MFSTPETMATLVNYTGKSVIELPLVISESALQILIVHIPTFFFLRQQNRNKLTPGLYARLRQSTTPDTL